MQLVTTVFTLESSERTAATHLPRGCREETALETGQKHVINQDACTPTVATHDGFEMECLAQDKRCWVVVPPSILVGQATTVNCEVYGLESRFNYKISVHQDARAVIEKELSIEDIRQGKITMDMPPLDEGIATFVLMEIQDKEITTILKTVTCCVLPEMKAVEDIRKILDTMIAIYKEEQKEEKDDQANWSRHQGEIQGTLNSDQHQRLWVWTEYFCQLLSDIELLFEWMESNREQVHLVLDVFVNVLEHCCLYEAWNFGAYLLRKAQDCGLEILTNQAPKSGYITAEELKEVTLFNQENSDQPHQSVSEEDSGVTTKTTNPQT
eukprot:g7806.t1